MDGRVALPGMRKLIFFALVMSGCASDEGGMDLDHHDARCVAACKTTAWDEGSMMTRECSSGSVDRCLDECEARIAGLPPLCQTCVAHVDRVSVTSIAGTSIAECRSLWVPVSECTASCQM